jgi:hypothetical protein
MGMFDNIKCLYPLPIEGLGEEVFQTKSTPVQFMDMYEIREDGTLWHEKYDIEDKSDPTKKGFARYYGCMTRVNNRWEQITDFTGEIKFYAYIDDTRFVTFSSYFVKGILNQLHLTEDESEE